MPSKHHTALPGEVDLAAFRAAARALLAAGVPPDDAEWTVAGTETPDLFGGNSNSPDSATAIRTAAVDGDERTDKNYGDNGHDDDDDDDAIANIATEGDLPMKAGASASLSAPAQEPDPNLHPASAAPPATVPPAFLALCKTVILHSDPGRFGLLYRLLWRLVHEPGLRHDPLDADRVRAEHLAQAVRRDKHKMTAFVRFRTVADPERPDAPLHIAWFEPEHHIVEAIAPFFVRRFTQMRWSILTPRRSAEWDGHALAFGPGARQQDAPPADAGESLWLTYYANIFNPARLKLKMMQKEMPRRYWHNLPEAQLIGELSARALERSATMISQPTTTPARRIRARTTAATSTTAAAAPHALAGSAHAPGALRIPIRSLDELKAATERCRECPIGQYATQSVVGAGPLNAALMVVGEQPGDQEDLRGQPFVGPAGRLFDRALAQLGWPRERLYVTNAVKHFKYEPRGKRRIHKTPAQQEVDACLHWLEDEVRLVAPQAILALGATAARAVLGRPVAVMKERGQWHTDPRGLPVLVTLHPSALLRADPAHGEDNFARWLDDMARVSEQVALAG